MTMAALIITACLLDAPRDCRDIDTLIRLPMSECENRGRTEALDFMRRHRFFEGRRLAGWACQMEGIQA